MYVCVYMYVLAHIRITVAVETLLGGLLVCTSPTLVIVCLPVSACFCVCHVCLSVFLSFFLCLCFCHTHRHTHTLSLSHTHSHTHSPTHTHTRIPGDDNAWAQHEHAPGGGGAFLLRPGLGDLRQVLIFVSVCICVMCVRMYSYDIWFLGFRVGMNVTEDDK